MGQPDKYRIFSAYCFQTILTPFHERVEKARSGKAGNNAIHQMRVACRQLRALLFNFKGTYPLKTLNIIRRDVKEFSDVLGPAREWLLLENQLTEIMESGCSQDIYSGVQLLIKDIHRQYKRQKKAIPAAADHMANSQGMAALQKISFRHKDLLDFSTVCRSPKLLRKAQEDIQRWIVVIFRDEVSLTNEVPTERFHQMRINMKYLRYTLQDYACLHKSGFKKQLSKLIALQDLMGDIHDLQVWEAHVAAITEQRRDRFGEEDESYTAMKKASDYLTALWQKTYMDDYHTFIVLWGQLKEDGFWRKIKLKTN